MIKDLEKTIEFFSNIKKTGDRIGLPEGFFRDYGQEQPDWVFILKTHALCETALNHLIQSLSPLDAMKIISKFGLAHKVNLVMSQHLLNPSARRGR